MTNYDVAKEFLNNPHGYYRNKYSNVSYDDGIFYSYGTAIAKITRDIDRNRVVIISDNNLSATTSKHISTFVGLSWGEGNKHYYLPQCLGRGDFNPHYMIKDFCQNLEWMSKAKLTQKPNRERLTHYYEMLASCLKLEDFKNQFLEIERLLNQYKEVYTFARDYKRGK